MTWRQQEHAAFITQLQNPSLQLLNRKNAVFDSFLPLLPEVSRVIDMYDGLKSYFLSQDKCPTLLKAFFNDQNSLLWLKFLQSQLKIFSATVMKIEGDNILATEVAEELDMLRQKIMTRKIENFQTLKMTSIISKLKDEGDFDEKEFLDTTHLFYNTFLEYLNKRIYHFQPLKAFHWIKLETIKLG